MLDFVQIQNLNPHLTDKLKNPNFSKVLPNFFLTSVSLTEMA